MGAIAACAITELKARAAAVADKMNRVYVRSVSFVIPASVTAGTAALTGLKLPPGTLILGGSLKPSQDFGGTATLAFKTETAAVTFCAAATRRAEASLLIGDGVALAVPIGATADDQVQVVLASAAAPGTDTTFQLDLVCCAVGDSPEARTTQTT